MGLQGGWVVFDGTGTVDIKASYNVLSVTDNGAGDYAINWIVPFASPFYAVSGTCGQSGSNNDCFVILNTDTPDDDFVNIKTVRGDRSPQDFKYVSVTAIGLAGS